MPIIPRLLFLLLSCLAIIGNGCACQEEARTMSPHMAIGHHTQTLVKEPFEVDVRADGTMRLSRLGQEPMQGKWEPMNEHIIQFTPDGSSDSSRYIVFWERSLGGLTFQVCDTAESAKMLANTVGRPD